MDASKAEGERAATEHVCQFLANKKLFRTEIQKEKLFPERSRLERPADFDHGQN